MIGGCGRNGLPLGGGDDSCGGGLSWCDGVCSDTRWDPANCGSCGRSCAPAQLCNQGRCVEGGSGGSGGGGGFGGGGGGGGGFGGGGGGGGGFGGGGGGGGFGGGGGGGGGGFGGGGGGGGGTCTYPDQICGNTCTNTASDPANCGYCGNQCANGLVCTSSSCVQGCTAPLVACSGTCVDTTSDSNNCGSCGHVCTNGQVCNGGACGSPCPDGSTFCGTTCTDLGNDARNCGGCAITCAAGEACQAGLCRGSDSVWPTLGGDVHHTGYNPVETGKPPLTMGWSVSLGSSALWPAVSDGTRIYVTTNGYFNQTDGAVLLAIAPASGQTLWQYNFGNIFSIGQATVKDGHVYVAQSNNSGSTYMFAFVAADGTLFWSQPFSSQWEHYWAPLVIGGRIYFDGGGYGGLVALDQANGAQLFFDYEEQWDEWSPLFFDNHVYTFTDGNVRRMNTLTGAVELSTTVMWSWNGYSMNTSPVSDGTRLYVISPPNLVAFKPTFGAPVWSANGAYTSQPAVANGVIYSIRAVSCAPMTPPLARCCGASPATARSTTHRSSRPATSTWPAKPTSTPSTWRRTRKRGAMQPADGSRSPAVSCWWRRTMASSPPGHSRTERRG